jgi:hypothetical protein
LQKESAAVRPVSLACLLTLLTATAFGAEGVIDYATEIKPLLKQRCVMCHGAIRQEAGLRLDAAQLIRAGGDSGPVLTAGKPDASRIVQAVRGADGVTRMPFEGEPLAAEEVAILTAWIEQGATTPVEEAVPPSPVDHWAFRPPLRPEVPTVRNAAWVRNPVDAFLAAKHEEHGLSPQPETDRRTLIRRVYLDLIGLPPTPAQVRAFLDDDSPDAYERVVDGLLESPHYAERWGRHWMDVWRYSDWYGYQAELRSSARHIWHWRDWIVESLAEDKPYDQMVREMLAADELHPGDTERLRATGFLARNYYKFNRNVWLDDTVEHTAKAFLGLTLNCARCHDHMYDPIPQREYYAFRAIFEPYQVRTDPLPGQFDPQTGGFPCVHDADLKTPTYLFQRGDDKEFDKSDPVAPAVPSLVVGVGFEIRPIELPPAAYYPGSRPPIRESLLTAADKQVTAKRQGVDASREALSDEREKATGTDRASTADEATKLLESEWKLRTAEAEAENARRQRESIRARAAADEARFSKADADESRRLATLAARAEREAALTEAELDVVTAEAALRLAEHAGKPEKDVAAARGRFDAAAKKSAAARQALTSPGASYQPLTASYPQTSSGRRAALAAWITDPQNPLTARVAVNHIWLRHFGQPLVPTVFDFGLNGESPTHPELLDWLAVEFIETGWSMKAMHRLLVTSATYRQGSEVRGQESGVSQSNSSFRIEVRNDESLSDPQPSTLNPQRTDPDNRYLWRMNSPRLESEVVRDSVLAVSGRLDRAAGGPELDAATGQTTTRRSLYYRHAPEKFSVFLQTFDAASTDECYRRDETVVPQQALAMMNGPLALDSARKLASDLSAASPDDERFIAALFERVLCRPATATERDTCLKFLTKQTGRLQNAGALSQFAGGSKATIAPSADPAQRARESLAHVLLNHNDFLVRR